MSSQVTRLPFVRRFCYSVGHVLNDLAASMWFSYLLIYLHNVINFNNALAGQLMLLGQVTDAICTPFVGYESDRITGMKKFGKRKTWHLVGTIAVLCSFAFIFNPCITCFHSPDWSQFIYYAPFVVIFQFGWASVQISHLSLIPELTPDENERVELNSWRFAFTVLSNLTVYGIAWLLFGLRSQNSSGELDGDAIPQFRILAFCVVGIGIVFSLIFYTGTKEKVLTDEYFEQNSTNDDDMMSTIEQSTLAKVQMTWKCWLKEKQFYQIASLYMCTRLVVNISQVYLPMYLLESLHLGTTFIAIIPLVVYVSGFLTSLLMRIVNQIIGRKLTYLMGIIAAMAGCILAYFVEEDWNMGVFGVAILLGFGGSTILVTSLSMTADFIGDNTESGAFVYGAMSFTDKLSNGIAVAIIQQMHPCHSEACCPACNGFYRTIFSSVPGGAAIFALIALFTLFPSTIGKRSKTALKHLPAVNSHISINGESETIPGTEYDTHLPASSTHSSPASLRSARSKSLNKTCVCAAAMGEMGSNSACKPILSRCISIPEDKTNSYVENSDEDVIIRSGYSLPNTTMYGSCRR